ncbi:unnamed protein product [Caenorhabditis auriculariae]|uniref:GDNF/GAS1 domain-containing protein n=1 Tax=Caenorhabditis auriculariae TaxID=2777116 RepID=A0A8S1HRL2_9PELO|nr:unnamed protein product [Caenorhabditis auriculariae]
MRLAARLVAYFLVLLPLASRADAYDSCLHYRSLCLRNTECLSYLQNFRTSCGLSMSACTGNSPSDCVYYLRKIRSFFPTDTCACYQALGSSEECDYFRQLIWNHPCERRLKDFGEELLLSQKVLSVTKNPYGSRRTTRTPAADRVKQLKYQLSGELETRSSLQTLTCDAALNEVCLRHVSCSQLWRLFRASCDVDQDNKCRMADREVCWQSFEGLSWTGLGDCRCASSNSSDCHWIRLHTNYNKCIYEISKSGQFPALTTLNEQRQSAYRQRYELRESDEYVASTTARWTTTTPIPTMASVPSTTPNPAWWNPAPTKILVSYKNINPEVSTTRMPYVEPRQNERPILRKEQTAAEKSKFNTNWKNERDHRRDTAIDSQSNSFKLNVRIEEGRKVESSVAFVQRNTTTRSSCHDAIRRCETVDECRWHLGELRVRCSPNSCRREECSSALQRFATYVPFAIVESVMFCHCAAGDATCLGQQELLYPRCLYRSSAAVTTCTQTAAQCDADPRCRHIRHALSAHCRVVNGECEQRSLDNCRRTILSARATVLEQPCFCPLSDVTCLAHQRMMIPNNPCIENAMLEYSRIMGYNSATSLETNRVPPIADSDLINLPMKLENSHSSHGKSGAHAQRHSHMTTSTTTTPSPPAEPVIPTPRASPRSLLPSEVTKRREKSRNRGRVTPTPRYKTSTAVPVTTTTTTTSTTTTTTTTTSAPSTVASGRGFISMLVSKVLNSGEENVENFTDEEHETPVPIEEVPELQAQPVIIKEKTDTKWLQIKTTLTPPKASEAPPPWVSTSPGAPTTTTVFVTHAPPPAEGCYTKDANGREIFTHRGSIIRRYVDWSGRCSTWCECEEEDRLECESLPCLQHATCDAPLTTLEFGERLYVKGRGACYCESGKFICELPEHVPETYPGLYLSIGYSEDDAEMLRKSVPREILDRAGFVSSNAATDIASHLQIAFERILPKDLRCRIVTMPEMNDGGNAFFRVEWFGMNELLNHTSVQWHSGGAEKICSPYVLKLADHFSLNESPRFQLVLSTVKQVKVLDYLNGLPSQLGNPNFNFILFLFTSILWILHLMHLIAV